MPKKYGEIKPHITFVNGFCYVLWPNPWRHNKQCIYDSLSYVIGDLFVINRKIGDL